MSETAVALSPAQLRFASEHDAEAGLKSATGTGIFFYHRDALGLDRWLVSWAGVVLESDRFQTYAA